LPFLLSRTRGFRSGWNAAPGGSTPVLTGWSEGRDGREMGPRLNGGKTDRRMVLLRSAEHLWSFSGAKTQSFGSRFPLLFSLSPRRSTWAKDSFRRGAIRTRTFRERARRAGCGHSPAPERRRPFSFPAKQLPLARTLDLSRPARWPAELEGPAAGHSGRRIASKCDHFGVGKARREGLSGRKTYSARGGTSGAGVAERFETSAIATGRRLFGERGGGGSCEPITKGESFGGGRADLAAVTSSNVSVAIRGMAPVSSKTRDLGPALDAFRAGGTAVP